MIPLTFRHRIWLLVALAAATLVTVTGVTLVLGARTARQLAGIETQYVPLIELDRDLKTLFAGIPRALNDAADTGEDAALREADKLYAATMQGLRAGRQQIADNGGDPAALENELRVYYVNAREVAAALVAGTTAAQLGTAIDAMRPAQQAFTNHLDAATTPDRRRLASAFATARASQRNAIWLDIAVAASGLVLMCVLSWWVIRYTVNALRAVTAGVERLARGEFADEIEVATLDELGDLAREANQTAVRLRDYREQAQRQAGELGDAYATLEARNATLLAAQQLLEDRATELLRGIRYKSEFLANMSHELRTPLNSILVLSRALSENEDRGMTASQVEFATLIHRSGEELLALINEVLDLAKVEAGKQTVVCESLQLADLLDYVRRMFQPLAAQKNLVLAVEGYGALPRMIRTDRARLAQILKNLIANAFKFTERGRVSVRVSRGPRGWSRDGGDLAIADPLIIAVSDTGIGIAKDQQAWIFEAFAQAETGISRKFGGTGLGLTIARQLAVLLGGDLTVESTVGVGSTFSLTLPIAGPREVTEAPARPVPPVAAPPPPGDRAQRVSLPPFALGTLDDVRAEEPILEGKTVLVIDDDMRNVYALSSALHARRLEVVTAADGQEALDELDRRLAIHAVVIDVMMPRSDGHDAIRGIRAHARFHDLPIIALAALPTPEERQRWIAVGATDYLPKPVDLDRLLALLRSLLA